MVAACETLFFESPLNDNDNIMTKNLLVVIATFTLAFTAVTVDAQPKQRSEKRGVAEEQFGYAEEIKALSPGICWTYNWGVAPSANVKSLLGSEEGKEMEYIPMAWDTGADVEKLKQYYRDHPGCKYLLGYNEPNLQDQSDITPQQAADVWPALEAIADEFDLKLVSPAMSYTGSAINDGKIWQPFDWLDEFIKLYKQQNSREPKMDAIAIHTYMNSTAPTLDFVNQWVDRYGKKIWVTEFAAGENNPDSLTQVREMIKKVQGLELNPNVERYAWFKGTSGSRWIDKSPYWRLLIKPNLRTHLPAAGTMTGQGVVYTYMSTFDKTYYYRPGETVMAKDYINSNGIGLEVSTDNQTGAINTHLAVEFGNSNAAEYLIDVPTDDVYKFTFRYSDRASAARQQVLKLSVDDVEVGSATLPSTAAYRDPADVYATTTCQVSLPAGRHTLKFAGTVPINHARVTWFSFASTTAISDINASTDDALVSKRYFTPQGEEVAAMHKGMYIETCTYASGKKTSRKLTVK